MKLLILAPQPFFQNRGTPIAVRMLTEVLDGDGHDIDLLVFHEGEDIVIGSARILRIYGFPGVSTIGPGFSVKKLFCDFLMMLKSIRLCHRYRYDAVHAVEEAVFIAMLLKLMYKIPYIYDVDSWLSDQLINRYSSLRVFRKVFTFFERCAVRYSSGAVAVCQALVEKIKEIESSMPVLRLEDVSLLEKTDTVMESLRERVGKNGQIVLYVGNLEKYQGIDLLLHSFSILAEEDQLAKLVIIGGNEDDRKRYQLRAEELAIDAQVFLIGPRPINLLGSFLRQADLLVSPRLDGENTPMKIYSYMASGVPLIATRIISHTQVLNDENAMLAEPDATSFAAALKMGLKNREHAAKLAGCAKELVDQEYSRPAFARKLTGFYRELSHVWNLRV